MLSDLVPALAVRMRRDFPQLLSCIQTVALLKIRAHSRHRSIATLMLYVDEHDRTRTQATLADLVAGTLTT